MLHAKAMLIDDDTVMSFLYSKEDIIRVEKWIKTLFKECDVDLKPAGKVRIIFENFFKMLSPAL